MQQPTNFIGEIYNGTNYQSWIARVRNHLHANNVSSVATFIGADKANPRISQVDKARAVNILYSVIDQEFRDNLVSFKAETMCPLDIVNEIKSKSEVITMTDRANAVKTFGSFAIFPAKTETLAQQLTTLEKYFSRLGATTDEYRVALLMEALDSNIFRTFKANVMFQSSPTYEDTTRALAVFVKDLPTQSQNPTPKTNKYCSFHKSQYHSDEECSRHKRDDSSAGGSNHNTNTNTNTNTNNNNKNTNNINNNNNNNKSHQTSQSTTTTKAYYTSTSQTETPTFKAIINNLLTIDSRSHTTLDTIWILDSGTAHHYTPNKQLFDSLVETFDLNVTGISGQVQRVHGIGQITLHKILTGGHDLILNDVRYVPDMTANLISELRLQQDLPFFTIMKQNGTFKLLKDGTTMLHVEPDTHQGGLITIKSKRAESALSVQPAKTSMTLQDAHIKLAHISPATIVSMADSGKYGFTLSNRTFTTCADCMTSNIIANDQPRLASRIPSVPGECINADLCGPLPIKSADGKSYISLLVDRYSGYCSVHTLPHKSSTSAIIDQLQLFQRELGHPIQTIRTDNGKEYSSTTFTDSLRDNNIIHEWTTVDSPAQNGKAERYLAILLAHSRAMLQTCQQHVGKEYWDYAVEYAAYLKNRLPHSSLPHKCSPVEMLGHAASNHAITPTFGCLCYTKLHHKTNKLDNRGAQTHFLGIPKTSSGMYTLAEDGKVFRSTNVTIARQSHFPVPATVLERAHLIQNLQKDGQGETWREPIADEIASHQRLHTFSLCDDIPSNAKILTTRFVFKTKLGSENQILKRKARLVIRGFNQREGIDFDQAYAPVINSTSLFLLLALAVNYGHHIHQVDVKTAYLNAPVHHELYACLPKNALLGPLSNCTIKLQKAIYGLRQAGYEWNDFLTNHLKFLGWRNFLLEPCLFRRHDCHLAVYVDDIVIIAPTTQQMSAIKAELSTIADIEDGGTINFLLGLRFVHNRDNKTLLVDQEAAIDRLLELFPASGPCTTPIHVKFVHDPTLPTTEYQHLEQCGSLSHIARFTRPDIAFAVNLASRFSSSPNPSAESLLLRIRNYLSNSKSLKLKFHGSTDFNLTCFSDSDFASGSDSKSTSACLIKLGLSPIHWSSQRQRSTATSTAEAEYTALSNMCKTTKFIIHLINFLGIPDPTVKIFCDNQAAIAASTAPAPSSKLRHMNVSIHFIREFVRNFPDINYIPSADNIADILTKALDQTTFDKFTSTLLL